MAVCYNAKSFQSVQAVQREDAVSKPLNMINGHGMLVAFVEGNQLFRHLGKTKKCMA